MKTITTEQFTQSAMSIAKSTAVTLRSLTITFLSMSREAFTKLRHSDPVLRWCAGIGALVMALYTLTVITSDVMSAGEIALVLGTEALLVVGAIIATVKLPQLASQYEGRLSLDTVSMPKAR